MSNDGAALGAAVPVSNARAAASRRNGAKSRGPKTPAGKARSAQNALRHGMRALRYVVLPDEDGVAFQALEAALMDELAPVGTLQVVLVRRVAMAAWRLARADRMEVELFEERRWEDAGVGMALIRDGNGTRSFETLMRYRGAAMAEFWRALQAPSRRSRPRRAPMPPPRPKCRSCPQRRRRLWMCRGSDPQRAPKTPIAADRTNPSASPNPHLSTDQSTSCPTHPGPPAPCTSPPRPGRRTNPRTAAHLMRRRRPHLEWKPEAALRLSRPPRIREIFGALLGVAGGSKGVGEEHTGRHPGRGIVPIVGEARAHQSHCSLDPAAPSVRL